MTALRMTLRCGGCEQLHSRTVVTQGPGSPGAVMSRAVQRARDDGWFVFSRGMSVRLVVRCPRCMESVAPDPRAIERELRGPVAGERPFWDSDELIGTVKRNSREDIRVRSTSKGNREYVDVRIFYPASDGNMRPGRGISLPASAAGDVAGLIRKAVGDGPGTDSGT